MMKVFVGGLPPDVDELELVGFVSTYAEVSTIKVVRDRITKKCKGYAFLQMTSDKMAEKAVSELDGRRYRGNTLTVNISPDK
jgi:RNA recognition motif-containing protein